MENKYNFWKKKEDKLNKILETENLSNFMNWHIIENTMFTKTNQRRKKLLFQRGNWKDLNQKIISPLLNHKYIYPNFIKQIYRILEFQNKTQLDITNLGSILEFGANYGMMSLLIHKMGFNNSYTIYELQPYTKLCKFFLEYHNYNNINYHYKTTDLQQKYNMLISMFALCETPVYMREKILSIDFDIIWIGYCKNFDNKINNNKYFSSFMKSTPQYKWISYKDKNSLRENYIVGIKKINDKPQV